MTSTAQLAGQGPLVELDHLTKHFPVKQGVFSSEKGVVHAVDQRSVDGVEALRPVQGDAGDAILKSCEFNCGHAQTLARECN